MGDLTTISTPRVIIAGTSSGVGVSTCVLGLLVALKRLGVSVAVAKTDASLVDTTLHRRVTARLAHNIDYWILSKEAIANSIARLSGGAELVIIEGDRGLFDQYESDVDFSCFAEYAALLKAPVILVFDAGGYYESVAALIKGFQSYLPGIQLAGVIANRIKDEKQNELLKYAIETVCNVRYLGGIPVGDLSLLTKSQIPRENANPSLLNRNRLLALGELISQSINLAAFRELSSTAGGLSIPTEMLESRLRRAKIAVADDAAFHMLFQDNLELIRRLGGEIIAFSPLADIKLPAKIGGVYLPGGYAHLYAADLTANKSIMEAINSFAAEGGVVLAEGGAVPYLCKKLTLSDGQVFDMVGLIPGHARAMIEEHAFAPLSYCEVCSFEETIISRVGEKCRGVRDTRWLVRLESKVMNALERRDRNLAARDSQFLNSAVLEGLSPSPHVLASSVHLHFGSNPQMARNFVDSVCSSVPGIRANLSRNNEQT